MESKELVRIVTVAVYLLLVMAVFTLSAAFGDVNIHLTADEIKVMKWSQMLSVIVVFILPSFIFAGTLSGEGIKYLNLHKRKNIKIYLLAVFSIIFSFPAINVIAALNEMIRFPESLTYLETFLRHAETNAMEITKQFLVMHSVQDLIMNLIVIAFFAGFGEELFFRGVVQKMGLRYVKNHHLAIWITAFLFSSLHGQFFGLIPRMLLGGMLGYMYYWSGSIWVPITAHFTNNALAVLISYYIGLGYIPEDIEKIELGTGHILLGLASVVAVVLLLRRMKMLSETLR